MCSSRSNFISTTSFPNNKSSTNIFTHVVSNIIGETLTSNAKEANISMLNFELVCVEWATIELSLGGEQTKYMKVSVFFLWQ